MPLRLSTSLLSTLSVHSTCVIHVCGPISTAVGIPSLNSNLSLAPVPSLRYDSEQIIYLL